MKTETEHFSIEVAAGRDSGLRKQFAPLAEGAVQGIHHVVPWLHPDHFTYASNIGTLIGGIIAANRDPKKNDLRNSPLFSLSITAGSQLLDGLDGSFARYLDKINPGSIDFEKGQLMDAGNDRLQEAELAILRQVAAYKRGDKLGQVLALLAGITNPIPSALRAEAEAQGIKIGEIGNNLLEFFGTRAGRFLLGTAATVYPNIDDVPLQKLLDGLTIAANITTAVSRYNAVKSGKKQEIIDDKFIDAGAKRAHFLWGLTGAIWGASIATYVMLNKQGANGTDVGEKFDPQLHKDVLTEYSKYKGKYYVSYLNWITSEARFHNIPIVFVGGTVTDFIGPQTEFDIDVRSKTIRLIDPNKPSPTRGNGTRKDIDAITFSDDPLKYQVFRETLSRFEKREEREGYPAPSISIEPARYEGKGWPERKPQTQMVTGWNVDENSVPYLMFEHIHHKIPVKSIERWTLVVPSEDENDPDLEIPMFNPVGHLLCYSLRVPSGVKKKDLAEKTDDNGNNYSKISLLENLAFQTIQAGILEGEDCFDDYFKGWFGYIEELTRSTELSIRIKKLVTGLYWSTVGTDMSQGGGIFKYLGPFKDKFSG